LSTVVDTQLTISADCVAVWAVAVIGKESNNGKKAAMTERDIRT
jgi:hypothetical protein